MPIIALDNRLAELIDLDAQPEQIASGFVFTEGPLWHPRERHLTFSDVRGDTMYRWSASGGTTVFRKPSNIANGNTWDRDGNLITCEHAGRRLSRTKEDGSVETIASDYEGKQLNSPNDVICLSNGDLVFTDPPYGLRRPDGSFGPQAIPFQGVFRCTPDGMVTALVSDFNRPNGLVVSDNGRTLYVCDTDQHHVRAFDIGADGSVSNSRLFADLQYGDATGRPDGMKLDSFGNLYVAANTMEGIWVFDPSGALIGLIGLPETPANLAWGGDDWRTMFVTASTSVYRLPMKAPGQPVFYP
jgi:gluconolactonase